MRAISIMGGVFAGTIFGILFFFIATRFMEMASLQRDLAPLAKGVQISILRIDSFDKRFILE